MSRSPKTMLRDLLPHGLVERRRRKRYLEKLGIEYSNISLSRAYEAVHECRFDLWPSILRKLNSRWVLIDVGANVGEYTAAVQTLASPHTIIAVEPLVECHSALEAILAQGGNGILIKAAAGEIPGTAGINVTGDTKMSSLLTPDARVAKEYGDGNCSLTATAAVPIMRIDDIAPPTDVIGMLKLDVQGSELSALRGATKTLERTIAVQIEINYIPHYLKACSFNEVHSFLEARDFDLYGVSEPYLGEERPLWADAVYCRQGPWPKQNGFSNELLVAE